MTKYFVEKFNASDDSFTITEVYVLSGSFVEDGKIIAAGTFEHVKNEVPNFKTQAKLMGI